ncbi:MAG: leucine-rich repeat protein [Chitinivibrionia bacterium]|nr:leucine-rich repeat protein [Chitinivibrionia bacterium]
MTRISWNFIVLASIVFATFAQSISAANWTGGGGQGMSITIWAPQARNLAENQDYLPLMVQGEFLSNFTKFSAIEVFDRERLDERYAQILSSAPNERVREEMIAELERERTHILRGDITRTTTGYNLQMRITRTADGATAAAYSGTFTFAELDDLTGIRRASLELLQGMNVALTASAQQELAGAAPANHVGAQTHNARAVVAQRQGRETEAMANFNMAAMLDPSLIEATNRLSILETNIRSGSIGDDVRGAIAWRRAWIERLTETEQFFSDFHGRETMPYTIFYATEITQGAINWQAETVNLSIETHLYGSRIWTLSIERTLQAVYDGLQATGQAQTWQLSGWPKQAVTNLNAFGRKSADFNVVFELLNEQNRVIGRQTLRAGGSWSLTWNQRPVINVNASSRNTLNFQNVNANDISDRMTIRVATVNGIPAETAARDGVLQIRAVDKAFFDINDMFRFYRGEIQGFARHDNRPTNLVIPDNIWGDPVISIGAQAFQGEGLDALRIPNTVVFIGDGAFKNNQLNRVNIPSSVISIGEKAFFNDLQHASNIARITIGANVDMKHNSFGREYVVVGNVFRDNPYNHFVVFYNRNRRQAGLYRFTSGWIYDGDNNAVKERCPKKEWIESVSAPNIQSVAFRLQDNIALVMRVGTSAFYQQNIGAIAGVIEGKTSTMRIVRNQRNRPIRMECFINGTLVISADLHRDGRVESITILNKDPNQGFGVFEVR